MRVYVLGYAMAILLAVACEKDENDGTATLNSNRSPVAKAGNDQAFTLASCSDRAETELDGSASFDPDGDAVTYVWQEVRGTRESRLRNTGAGKAKVINMIPGSYLYVLTVKDVKGEVARDTLAVLVTAPARPYDLDISFTTSLRYEDNFDGCDWDYMWECPADKAEISGQTNLPPFGPSRIWLVENADTAATSDVIKYSYVELRFGAREETYLAGQSNINFKRLMRQGGGPFTGILTFKYGSADKCNSDAFLNAPPVVVSGNLDAATGGITLNIKGKTFLE